MREHASVNLILPQALCIKYFCFILNVLLMRKIFKSKKCVSFNSLHSAILKLQNSMLSYVCLIPKLGGGKHQKIIK